MKSETGRHEMENQQNKRTKVSHAARTLDRISTTVICAMTQTQTSRPKNKSRNQCETPTVYSCGVLSVACETSDDGLARQAKTMRNPVLTTTVRDSDM